MKRIYLALIVLVGISVSCTKNFEDWQKDEKHPTEVPGDMLFTNALKDLADQVAETNVNVNNWKLFCQYWTETTYTNEANYDIISRTVSDGVFEIFYRDVLKDLSEAKKLIAAEETVTESQSDMKNNRLQIIEILEVYVYQRLVDIFGNVPFTEAINIDNIYPAYDDGLTVYKSLVPKLDAAIGAFKGSGSFVGADIMYNGNIDAWKTFAYSLKLRMGITIADADEAFAKATFEAAEPHAFASSADNAELVYLTAPLNNTNPLYQALVASGRDDYVPANTLVDLLNDFNDPRMYAYLQKPITFVYDKNDTNEKIDTELTGGSQMVITFENGDVELVALPHMVLAVDSLNVFTYYKGGQYGYPSSYGTNSHVAAAVHEPTFPSHLMTYTEVLFYKAEAAARGWSAGGSTEDLYNAAITSSFDDWGVDGAEDYLATEGVAWDAAGDWKQQIGTQSWLGNYERGFEAWTTYRRLDWPLMNVPEAPETEGGVVPTRLTFPVNEQTLNPTSYTEAASAVGGDLLTTKLFWDKH